MAQRPGFGDRSVARTVTSLLITGALFAGVLSTQGRFDKIFSEFGVTLPFVTNVVRSACFAWLVGTLFSLTIIKELLLKSTTKKAVYNTIAIYAALLLAVVYVVGMFRPLIVIVSPLSK